MSSNEHFNNDQAIIDAPNYIFLKSNRVGNNNIIKRTCLIRPPNL